MGAEKITVRPLAIHTRPLYVAIVVPLVELDRFAVSDAPVPAPPAIFNVGAVKYPLPGVATTHFVIPKLSVNVAADPCPPVTAAGLAGVDEV